MRIRIRSSILIGLVVIPLITLILTGCGASSNRENPSKTAMADMPEDIRSAPTIVRQSYQYAVDHPDLMKQIPCYCGCVDLGHTSNYACYVTSVDSTGKITYDDHALGCSICVDITQDVVRLSELGKSTSEIRTYIDQTYSQYGPANIP